MIIAVTMYHKNEKTGRTSLIVSHGVERETGKHIVLPCEHPKDLGAAWNAELLEWILPAK